MGSGLPTTLRRSLEDSLVAYTEHDHDGFLGAILAVNICRNAEQHTTNAGANRRGFKD